MGFPIIFKMKKGTIKITNGNNKLKNGDVKLYMLIPCKNNS
tara:strand:+ start:3821 stop:3943 length:123 start_codon:yes stop_codon:yes gene_type:complete